jgi:hypothetical protein
MADAVVVLTPIVVMGVLLLLGFAGCDVVFGLRPVPHTLCVRVRVPVALMVTEITLRIGRPGGEITILRRPDPIPGSTDGGDNVFRVDDGQLQDGSWTVSCRVRVVENGVTADRTGQGTFVLDGTIEAPCANFKASGTPSAGFNVAYTGLT